MGWEEWGGRAETVGRLRYVPSPVHAYVFETAAVEYVFLVHNAATVGGQRFQTLAGVAHFVLLARVQPPVGIGRGDDQLRLAEREPRLFVVTERVGVHLLGQQQVVRHFPLNPLSTLPVLLLVFTAAAAAALVRYLIVRMAARDHAASVQWLALGRRLDDIQHDHRRRAVVLHDRLRRLLLFVNCQRPE